MARWVQRHLLKSIIFCTTFFLALFIDNKNVVFFRARQLKWPSNTFFSFHFIDSHATSAGFARHMKRRVIDVWLCGGLGGAASVSPADDRLRICNQTRISMVPSNARWPENRVASEHESKLFFFRKKYKWIHDLSQRKSTWRAQVNELKEKRNFAASSCASSTAFFSTNERLQFYMQHVH